MPDLETKDIISILAMLISLLAVIIGPIVTFKIAKRQIISPIRQKWIDELRELMSEYLSECYRLLIVGEDGILAKEETDEVILKKMLHLEQKINLILNPNETKHIELKELIKSITEEIYHGANNLSDIGERLNETIKVSQEILKTEWKRVKNGEI